MGFDRSCARGRISFEAMEESVIERFRDVYGEDLEMRAEEARAYLYAGIPEGWVL